MYIYKWQIILKLNFIEIERERERILIILLYFTEK